MSADRSHAIDHGRRDARAREDGRDHDPPELTDPKSPPSAEQIIAFLRSVTGQFFPRLAAAK